MPSRRPLGLVHQPCCWRLFGLKEFLVTAALYEQGLAGPSSTRGFLISTVELTTCPSSTTSFINDARAPTLSQRADGYPRVIRTLLHNGLHVCLGPDLARVCGSRLSPGPRGQHAHSTSARLLFISTHPAVQKVAASVHLTGPSQNGGYPGLDPQ